MTVVGALSSFRKRGEMSPHKRACVDWCGQLPGAATPPWIISTFCAMGSLPTYHSSIFRWRLRYLPGTMVALRQRIFSSDLYLLSFGDGDKKKGWERPPLRLNRLARKVGK